jgi:hypothetical protein
MQGLRILWHVAFGLDSLHACVAFGPLAIYLLLIGGLNLSRRPFLVSGTRDAAALGLALSGFVIVGPLELCLPDAAAVRFGPFVWVLLLVFYALCVVLGLLLLRPRLIVYNASADQLRAVLAGLTDRLDSDARWAGDVLVLPGLGVQLHLDSLVLTRNVSLAPVGANQDPLGWQRLESALAAALSRVSISRNTQGGLFVAAGLTILLGLGYSVASDPQAVAQALLEMLRI